MSVTGQHDDHRRDRMLIHQRMIFVLWVVAALCAAGGVAVFSATGNWWHVTIYSGALVMALCGIVYLRVRIRRDRAGLRA